MIDPLTASMRIAGAALGAQSVRMRVIAENLANAQSTATQPGGLPYARKVVSFESELDKKEGVSIVQVKSIESDGGAFRVQFDPGHPAADKNGYVKLPNVNMLIEMADMREAGRSYEASLQMMRQSRNLVSMMIDLLRSGQ